MASISVVGSGFEETRRVGAKVFGAMGMSGISVISLARGSSKYNLSSVADEAIANHLVRTIHEKPRLGETDHV